jgi:hypothetical protein
VLKNFEMCWGRSYKESYGSSSCLPDEG